MRRNFTIEFTLYVSLVLLSSVGLSVFAGSEDISTAENDFLKACSTGDLTTVESYHPQSASAADNSQSAELQGSNFYAKGLLLAAQNDHAAVVKALLSFPRIDANKPDENGISPLFYASSSGYLDVVLALLEHETVRKNQAWRQKTPLYIAAENGHIEVVKALANAGAATESQCDEKRPIHVAAENGHEQVVTELLRRGCDIDPRCHGETPLHLAIRKDHIEVVRVLVDNSQCDINSSSNGQPAIHMAVEWNHPEIVNILANAPGIKLNNPYLQQTPAVRAAGRGFVDVVKSLVLACKNINSNWDESALLVEATREGRVEVVKYLLDTLPTGDSKRRYIKDSLLGTAAKHGHVEVVRTLLKSNISNCDASRIQWKSAWYNAISGEFIDVIMVLLEEEGGDIEKNQDVISRVIADALLNFSTSGNFSAVQTLLTFIYKKDYLQLDPEQFPEPFLRACEHGHPEVIRAYINTFPGFDMNRARNVCVFREGDNNTCHSAAMPPLILASWYGKNEVVEFLLNYISYQEEPVTWIGLSPLYVAVLRKHVDTARVLLQHNPQAIDDSDGHGKTLLHLAVINNQPEMIELLTKYGANPHKIWKRGNWHHYRTPLSLADLNFWHLEWWSDQSCSNEKENQTRKAIVKKLRPYERQFRRAEVHHSYDLPARFHRLSLGGKK